MDKKLPSMDNFLSGRVCTKTTALKREKYLKSGAGRRFIRSLIEMRQQ